MLTNIAGSILNKTAEFIYDTPVSTGIASIAGLTTLYFAPQYSPPLLALSLTTQITRLVIKILDQYNFTIMERLRKGILAHEKCIDIVYTVAVIITLLVIPFFPMLSLSIAIITGIFKGVITVLRVDRVKQNISESTLSSPIPTHTLLNN